MTEPSKPFTLPKRCRVTNRKIIDKLFNGGLSFTFSSFRVLYIKPQKAVSPLQAGFAVSKRTFKKAVQRNRIKRLMKECYRVLKNPLGEKLAARNGNMAVFIIYTGKDVPDHKSVSSKMVLILHRLEKLVDEDVATHP